MQQAIVKVVLQLLAHIVSRDQICQAVYPDVKNYSGISDHAIDQLVHRLRSKVPNYKILTQRGIGIKLIK
ncbi:helix-turn-helix domain-containing protein [Candidatus Woesebacteria bacterium]|nr:helix-turn-helix domain-containing protein [Candidatus Woesebacteria bacterium]